MKDATLRGSLFNATRDLHERLDALAGPLADLPSCRRYLATTYAFRAGLEPLVAEAEAAGLAPGWRMERLLPELGADLADLAEPVPAPVPGASPPDAAGIAGLLYVAEGSGLGARLIARRAAALGCHAGFGARHLARQCGEAGRWRRFLDWLEAATPDRGAAAAARATFAMALAAHEMPEAVT